MPTTASSAGFDFVPDCEIPTTAVATTGMTLLAACSVFVVYDYVTVRARMVRDITLLADIVGSNCTAALTFTDAATAAEILDSTEANSEILYARLFTSDGSLLATYSRADVAAGPHCPGPKDRPVRACLFSPGRNRLRRR